MVAEVSHALVRRNSDRKLSEHWRALCRAADAWRWAVASEMATIYSTAASEERDLNQEENQRIYFLDTELAHVSLISIAMGADPELIHFESGGARKETML